ncbi:MAG: hypothetical protein KY467_18095 [Gemmatimonadetes bacterium]|nr:hypothetical protein [Gemmatimonadota bacterium]
MLRLRLLCTAFISAALAAAACDGSGEHNTPDEADQAATRADSAAAGTAVPSTLPPAGTANPAAASGPGTYADSAPSSAVGRSQGATPGSPNPADPVHSGAASDSAR